MSTITAITTAAKNANSSYLNVAISAGTNRTVYLVFSGKGAGIRQITTATLDGVSPAAVIQNGGIDGGQAIGISIAVFTETELPAAGSYTVVPTWDGTTNYNTLAVIEVANGPQSAPFIGTVQVDTATAALGQIALTGTVTDGEGGIVIGLVSAAEGADISGSTISANSANLGNLVSEVSQTQAVTFVMRDDVAASASENYSMTLDTNSVTIDSIAANFFAITNVPDGGPNVSTYDVDLSEKAGFQTLQVKIADADTANNGLFASDVITVEDDMLVSVETVKDGVTINLATDGNISVDKTELDNAGGSITLNPEYFSPGTGNISVLPYTFTAPVEPGLSPVISGPETPNAIELSPLSLGYTITNRNGEAPTLTGVDAALFSITNTGGDNYTLAKLTNTGAVGTTYNVTINIDNLSEPAVTLPITITCIAATASTGMNKLGIKIGIGL